MQQGSERDGNEETERRKAGILSEGPTPEQQTTGEGKAQHLLGVKVSEVE